MSAEDAGLGQAMSAQAARELTPSGRVLWFAVASLEFVVTLAPCMLLWPLGAVYVACMAYCKALAIAFRRAATLWNGRVKYGRNATCAEVAADTARASVVDSNPAMERDRPRREINVVGHGGFSSWLNWQSGGRMVAAKLASRGLEPSFPLFVSASVASALLTLNPRKQDQNALYGSAVCPTAAVFCGQEIEAAFASSISWKVSFRILPRKSEGFPAGAIIIATRRADWLPHGNGAIRTKTG
jgi:hypothetical protein